MSKITHNEAREILNKIYYHCEDVPRQEELEQYFLQQEQLENAYEYQKNLAEKYKDDFMGAELSWNLATEKLEKQQKLLELYKKLYNGCTDYHDYDELKEIQKQIKELEK